MHVHVVWEEVKTMKQALFHYLHVHKEIKWLIFFYGFLWTFTPSTLRFLTPFWQSLNIPIALFGIIWAFMIFFRALATKLSPYLDKNFSRKNIIILLSFLIFIWYFWLALFSKVIWSLIFFLFFQAAFWISKPLFRKYINELVSSKLRATVLSINSMFQRLVFVIFWPIIWYFFDILTFSQAFLISWSLFTILLWFCYFMMRRYKLL